MQAREYAKQSPDKHVGYIECLRNIRRDHASGEQIDFTDWEEAERLCEEFHIKHTLMELVNGRDREETENRPLSSRYGETEV